MTKYQNVSKTQAVRRGSIAPRRKRAPKDEQEFGLAGSGYILCSDCKSVFFDKSWHHRLDEDKHFSAEKNKNIKFAICPACDMLKKKEYEGELIIRIKNQEARIKKDEVLNSIQNSDEMARERDPMDRVLWTENNGDEIKVYTSENQLAVIIGKKLDSSFPGGKLKIEHSHGEDLIRVFWER
ncbi:MAG: hypothetical protein A2746_01320 [Candidatus Yanofskybacteria bacterium RIFCSPHIGHO2_01_FULL_44_22]|uniref:Nmd3 N-terminal domain-containing protein n=1 Tax=Candidatus Yanofskybacteria bacterium RIFCSPHIGHO2_01_FULL_44_22 TaxID=1802669 RepID=A0A1F8EY83_9BACT|nr:MAG: hypothetical protein A2746_01320 [Candidatus Yanofskybacteria bacterium RIFCSPHIGHO2_01_FULL_44_22]